MAERLSDAPAVIIENSGVGAVDESTEMPFTPLEPTARVNKPDADVFNDALRKLQNNMYQHLRSNR